MSEQFPLVKQAGLSVRDWIGLFGIKNCVIDTADVERWLEQAPVVYGVPNKMFTHLEGIHTTNGPDTHTARLVCIQPLSRDTAQSLLREFIGAADAIARGEDPTVDGKELADRARRLLGQEGE